MKTKLFVALSAALAVSTPAQAGVTIDAIPGTDPYSGPAPTFTFDPASQPTISGGAFVGPGTTDGQFAQPWGTSGMYYSVGPSTSSPGIIDLTSFAATSSLSFIWGSVDNYNYLDVLAGDLSTVLVTFDGTDVALPANGDQFLPATNPLVTLTFTGADQSAFGGLRLRSSQNAFEIDNLTVNAPVPEPSTWAMMLFGFGALGFAMRRRRKDVKVRFNYA